MANTTFLGSAVAVQQVSTGTVALTWATNDTATTTLNGKDLVVTVGTPVTVTDVAALIVRAFNSETRINDALGSSNVGGQSIPEFAGIVASNVAGVVTFTRQSTNNTKLFTRPFTLTLAETTAGTGTWGSFATSQASTGPHHFDNVDNWSGGIVPANDDVAIYQNSEVDCLFNLPNLTKQVALRIYNSYAARLGLSVVNKDNSGKPFAEFLQRHVRLDDAGSGAAITHVIGIGSGPGPKLVNIRQDVLTATFEVDTNRQDPSDGTKIVNIIAPDGGTVLARKGSIDISDQDGETANWTAITTSGRKGQTAEIDILSTGNASTACVVIMVGGKLAIDWATWSTNGLTLVGAECTVDTCGIPSAQISEGTLFDIGNGTIATLTLNKAGVLDVSRGAGTITITNANLHPGCKVVNPGKRITLTNAAQTYGLLSEVAPNLDFGYNRTIQIAG